MDTSEQSDTGELVAFPDDAEAQAEWERELDEETVRYEATLKAAFAGSEQREAGDNCGTGAGGFQAGNKCAAGGRQVTAQKADMDRVSRKYGTEPPVQWPMIDTVGGFDSLVMHALDDAQLPEIHFDGLVRIEFGDLQQYALQRYDNKPIDIYGLYDHQRQTIILAANTQSNRGIGGTTNVSVFGGQTILHEIGHHVHLAKLTDAAADEWAGISQNGQTASISNYARTNRGEHFAEAYRAYARSGGSRRALRALEPRAYKYMQSLWNSPARFLARGNASTEMKRYADA